MRPRSRAEAVPRRRDPPSATGQRRPPIADPSTFLVPIRYRRAPDRRRSRADRCTMRARMSRRATRLATERCVPPIERAEAVKPSRRRGGAAAQQRECTTKGPSPAARGPSFTRVEVRGIEPRSGDAYPDLLRAQSASGFSRPQPSSRRSADRPSHLRVPVPSVTNDASSGFLDDARIRVGSSPGLTDFEARSGGEGEVGALGIGTYWLTDIVNEISLHPRPASSRSTTTVETDHPL